MGLQTANYRQFTGAIRRADGTVGEQTYYQYESETTVYEVAHKGGSLCYRVNFGAWLIAPFSPIHTAIVQHFGLVN